MMLGCARTVVLMLLVAIAACRPQEKSESGRTHDTAAAPPAGPAALAPVAEDPSDANALIAENDRIIAENKRIVARIAGLRRDDPVRFDRLEAECERQFGAATDSQSETRVFGCVERSWSPPIRPVDP